ncbi:hypothetical protein SISSUDRAFT_1046495 [Sistotremastrum suecicum HHB10207 ss-3]|uniref:Histidine kinase n=1 Tax=Sistotremastrum suecicum HHB10207 ss-3 TaxID=1314776 RepID=A0A166DPF0_9AGAM|nr:hypothetical protein SISSUDRAFT_1046495 [Sistotremastrum suecicum HHB10207 ss-3]
MDEQLENHPTVSFLSAYPHPCCIFSGSKLAGQVGISLAPVWANRAFYRYLDIGAKDSEHRMRLALGDRERRAAPLLQNRAFDFVRAFDSLEDVSRFGSWLDTGSELDPLTVSLRTASTTSVEFAMSKTTILQTYIVLLTTPSQTLPIPSPQSSVSSRLSLKARLPTLKLSDLPSFGRPQNPHASLHPSSHAHVPRPFEIKDHAFGSMARRIEAFDWPSVGLPSYAQWPQSLRTATSYVLSSIYPTALWWGPELVLLYNDAYATMSGSKHPSIFAQKGRVSWGEIWDTIGPLATRALAGESIAKLDDLLFFNNLGDEMSARETYHSWSWAPVMQEDGTVGGLVNLTFETTQKVITARRIASLQKVIERAVMAQTRHEFAKNVVQALECNSIDTPFAAFYYSSCSSSTISTAGPQSTFNVSLSLASAYAIPSEHPYFPERIDFSVPNITLRNVRSINDMRIGSWDRDGVDEMEAIGQHGSVSEGGGASDNSDEEVIDEMDVDDVEREAGSMLTRGSLRKNSALLLEEGEEDTRSRGQSSRRNMSFSEYSGRSGSGSVRTLRHELHPIPQNSAIASSSNMTTPEMSLASQPSSYPMLQRTYSPLPIDSSQTASRRSSMSASPQPGKAVSLLSSAGARDTNSSNLSNHLTTTTKSFDFATRDASLNQSRDTYGSSLSYSSSSGRSQSFSWNLQTVFQTRQPVHIPHLPPEVLSGLEKRGWGEHPREAVVVPIVVEESTARSARGSSSTSVIDDEAMEDENGGSAKGARNADNGVVAIMILGVNSRGPYDPEYANYVDMMRTNLGTALSSIIHQEAEAQRNKELQSLDAAKSAFFSNASHELRTPLTLIAAPLQDILEMTTVDGAAKTKLKMMQRNVARLGRLVDSLLDFSRIEAGKLVGRFRPVRIGEFTEDLASLFRGTIEKNNLEFIVDCPRDRDATVYLDPDFWEKICFNLIGNAFKYTLTGTIAVRVYTEGSRVLLTIADTGVGIPQSDIAKIGERFHRVTSISRSYEGTGIGLSLTRELINLHHGTLDIESQTAEESSDGSHGSVFTVSLPLGKGHFSHELIEEEHEGREFVGSALSSRKYAFGIIDEANLWSQNNLFSGGEPTPDEMSTASGGDSVASTTASVTSSEGSRVDRSMLFFDRNDVILLVDDNADMRRYIRSLFEPYCKIMEAANGKDALELVDKVIPNLVLTDRMMPVMDGYALLQALKQRPVTRLVPVVLLTAQAGDEARVDGLLSGADDYLSKPFKGRELIARANLQLQLGKRRIELEAKFELRTQEIKLISDLSPVGIARADMSGHITYANDKFFEYSGHPRETPDEWLASVDPEFTDEVATIWKKAFEELSSASLEMRWKNGRWTKGSIEPLIMSNGVVDGMIGTITDISERRMFEATRLELALAQEANARKRAEEAEAQRQEADERRRGQELLIDVTSHELRQPVSAIINCSSLVRSNLTNLRETLARSINSGSHFEPSEALIKHIDEDLEALDAIYQCGLAQERIANDVLSLSRIQLNVLSIQPVEFDLKAEVERIISIFRNEVKMKSINMNLRFGQSLQALAPQQIKTDKARLAQVITNLLSNAIKFTDTSVGDRTIGVQVDVSFVKPSETTCVVPEDIGDCDVDFTSVNPVYLCVAVKDSGPGLDPGDLALLFKRFQQGSNSHDVFGGSGLGLFVSRQLCHLMGGSIGVESEYGSGATFRFFITASTVPASTHGLPISKLPRNSKQRLTAKSAFPNQISRDAHILITEDNLINQTVLNRQLTKEGFRTSLAANGKQAIDQIEAMARSGQGRRNFDAILMDCEMPVMDGYTAVREIRRMEASGELPNRNRIFALTGNARAGQVQSARDAGMDDVIIKPYRLDDLLAKLIPPTP